MAKGLITQSGAGTVKIGTVAEGLVGQIVIQVTSIANPATVKGKIPGAGATSANLVDLQVKNRTTDAMAATIAAAGIYVIDAAGLELWIEFGAGDTVYIVNMVAG